MGSKKQKVRVRIYEVDHKKVKLYAVKNAKALEEAYSDIISRVLDDEGKWRGKRALPDDQVRSNKSEKKQK